MPRRPYLYYAHTMPGLQEIAWTEVRARMPGSTFEGLAEFPAKNGLALFRFDGAPEKLLKLRTAEDVFFLVQQSKKVEWGRAGLTSIFKSLERNRFVDAGLAAHRAAAGSGSERSRTFRVISRMAGRQHAYRRIDFGRAVEKALRNRLGKKWRAVKDGGDVEFWANLIGSTFICGLRLSDARMRHRDYKQEHLAASLRPSVAAALVWLANPEPSDVFLDPMCGAGTILVERAMAARHRLLLGGDLRSAALEAAAANIGRRHKPRLLARWDARGLPLRASRVDKVVTNPPFGKQLGTRSENVGLYARLLGELDRVLRPSGRIVMISSEADLIRQSVRRRPGLHIVRGHPVTILGQRATIYIIERPK